MSDAFDKLGDTSSLSSASHPAHDSHTSVTTLRGADAVGVGRKGWVAAGAVVLIVLAVIVIVGFLSAANDNARIDRMKSQGISVSVAVTNCTGNLGGSGSNAAGYTCQGSYRLGGHSYSEVINEMSSFASPGSKVTGVVDPSDHGFVELATSVAAENASSGAYVRPGILALLFLLVLLVFVKMARRSRPTSSQ